MESFDWRYYISRYSDLRDAGVVNKKRAVNHWNRIGRYENRYPNKQVEQYHINKKKQQILDQHSEYYENNTRKNEYSREESTNSSFDTNVVSLNEIKNIYSNAKIEFTKSEQSSEFQSHNAGLIQENNNKINLLLNNLKVVYNEILSIKNNVYNLERRMMKQNENINIKNSSLEEIPKKEVKSKTKKKTSINQKIVSSDEYSDFEESEGNEIKYSNSDEFIDNNDIEDEIIEGNFKNLNFHSTTVKKKETIPIDEIDNIVEKKETKVKETEIDSLIKNINVKDKVKKKKVKKIVSLKEESSDEESSETLNDNLKEIDNIEHKSILNKILNKEIKEEVSQEENNFSKNSILNYLKSENSNINDVVSFNNNKLNKLITNISSKKI